MGKEQVTPEIIDAAQRIVDLWNQKDAKLDEFWTACDELYKLTGRIVPHQMYTALNIAKGYLK